jgi:ABC-type multidrug transport system ATPase subunit
MAAAPVLTARGVARRFGARTALAPTDLEIRDGELIALVGPNGAGKSLLALLAGLLPATAGSVVTGLAPTAVGWAPQRPAQYRRLSARENLAFFARLLRLPDIDAACEAMLAAFELPNDARPSAELSVGNQQRLNLAIAFLGAPRLLLLDEPTASLDSAQARALWQRVARSRDAGTAAVIATHLVAETFHADRVVALRDGRVVFDDAAVEKVRALVYSLNLELQQA